MKKSLSVFAIACLLAVNCTVDAIHVTGIALNKTSLSLTEGDEYTLDPTITPENASDKSVVWTSDNEAVATVSPQGLVKALKAGKATVSATTVDLGKTATCSIDVEQGMGAVTGEATHISCRNAEISGKAILPGTTSTDLSFGVLYSTSSGALIGSATMIEAKSFDADYTYTVNTEVLEPDTTYYYRSYIIQDKEIAYGELKSFNTLAVSSMIKTEDASDINPKDAVLNAALDLADCKYDDIEYGFEVTPEGGQTYTVQSTKLSDKKFSVKDSSLTRETGYSFAAYVKLDGHTYLGETKSFTAPSVQSTVTAESSNEGCISATISGKLTIASEGTFTQSAVLYYSGTASTLEALKSSGTQKTLNLGDDGSYSEFVDGFAYNAKSYYCVVAKVDDVEFASSVNNLTTKSLPAGPVDLGLSVKWSSVNMGATNPWDSGRYFAWGDVTGQTWNGSSWSGDGFSTSPDYTVDSNNNLKPEYDAAHVILGGNWRMPTKAECDELINNCTCTWTTVNGTKGRVFTSNKTGYSDKAIFLPAAGYGGSSTQYNVGSNGYYWSSTFFNGYFAWNLGFSSGDVSTSGNYRRYGRSVRPVSE